MKKILSYFFFFIFGIGIVFAAGNFIKSGENWDTFNYSSSNPVNDKFSLDGRLDLEDSRTYRYINNGYRGKITGTIVSDLFGNFNIDNKLDLNFKSKNPSAGRCGGKESLEEYKISGKIYSEFWGDLNVDETNSYFCSNRYTYIKFISPSIGEKEIGMSDGDATTGQGTDTLVDNFGKQEISISGIAKVKGDTGADILNRGDGRINNIGVSVSKKTVSKKFISKNISRLFRTYKSKLIDNSYSLNSFLNTNDENYYLYDYAGQTEIILFDGGNYINEGKNLEIGNNGSGKIGITGKHTVIVKSGNIYINSNLYNTNDSSSLLVLISKKGENGDGGNIYINPDVTNIDAILIADGSLISLNGNNIPNVKTISEANELRKQLLIYGSVLSSNVVGTDDIPYGADYYEVLAGNIMEGNIYDLGNLRTFNLNYGLVGSTCEEEDRLVPIDGNGGQLLYAWVGQRECYNSDDSNGDGYRDLSGDISDSDLRDSDKRNPLIVEYNKSLQFINPYILKQN